MTRPLTIISASTVTLEQFAEAHDRAFANYFFPFSANAEMFARRVRVEQIDLYRSLLAYDGDELFGAATLAVRGEVGRLASLGLAEQQRGRGRSHELMDAVIEQARSCGLKTLKLEVLTHNIAAIRLYQRAGLSIVRNLLLLERAAKTVDADHTGILKAAAAAGLLRHFVRLHQAPPTWSRDLPSLLVMENLRGLYLGDEAMPDAYVLFDVRADGGMIIKDLAAADVASAAVLCANLCRSRRQLIAFNEPEESVFITPLKERGFVEIGRQHEMACEL